MLYPLLAVLAVLWTADLVQTLKVTGRYGPRAEYNPFARFLLKHSKYDFIAFKAVDFGVVSAILLFVYKEYVGVAYALLTTFILIYIYVIFHNHTIVHTMEMEEKR